MGPRSNPFWEFHSLCFWWAAWSLADTYLLPLTPLSEIAVIWICVVIAGMVRIATCLSGPQRYTECSEEVASSPPPLPNRATDPGSAVVDAV